MRFNFIFILILTFLSIELFSQELILSYDELIELTLKNNLTIKNYEEKFVQSKLKTKEVIFSTLPQIKLTGRYSRLSEIEPFILQLPFLPGSPELRIYEPVEEQTFTRLSIDLPLFTGLRQINSIKAQREIAYASEEDLNFIKAETIYKAKELYLKLFLAYQYLKLIESNIDYLESQKKIAENFLQNGLIQENEVLKIDIALTQSKVKFFDQQNLISKLNLNLCQILNLDLTTKIIPSIEVDKLLTEEDLAQREITNRPDILSLRHLIKANEYNKKSIYGSFLPAFFFNAGYDYAKPNPKFFPVKNEWKYSWDMNIVMQFTLWDWLLPYNRAEQVELQNKQLENQLDLLIARSKIEFNDAINRLNNEKLKTELFFKELEFATENQRITENKFKVGLATSTDLLDANKQKVEAELKLLESKINQLVIKEELKKLNGSY